MAKKKCEVLVLNNVAQVGLKRFPAEIYSVVKESKDPWAILVRSQDLHKFEFGPSLRAVGRAGAGVNQARHPGVQRAGRQCQRREGAGARRHADRRAQSGSRS
jgi:D-3-phosphoglycerate dehydrogenase